ncbi:MAG TPA: hypothetical protein VGS18_00595, partial [Thermoplasmata archaeon]|nr:hypothetical protein [Thermoplasmata archaeon]
MFAPPGVEDPISAIFDLSDRVADMAPTMRRMYRYTATVIVAFLLIMVFLLFVGLAQNVVYALLALVAIVFGFVALSLLRETDRFYRAFAERHRVIRLLQDAEPAPKIPEGRTPMQRLARYLARSSPRIATLLLAHPEALRYRARVGPAASPTVFDLAMIAPSTGFPRLGLGEPGFVVLARLSPDVPTVADLDAFGQEIRGVESKLPARVVRAILLRGQSQPLPESVYDYAVG